MKMGSKQTALFCIVGAMMCTSFLIALVPVMRKAEVVSAEGGRAWDMKRPKIVIDRLEDETYDEWAAVLRTGEIEYIVNEDLHGLADKFMVVFRSGHRAVAKYVQPFSLAEADFQSMSAHFEGKISPRRAGRKMQGWPEVAAGAVARAIGGEFRRRKIPSVIRAVSSTALYSCIGCDSWWDWLRRWLPQQEIPLCFTAYMSGLTHMVPDTMNHLFLADPESKVPSDRSCMKYGDFSDVILFDFLVDSFVSC